MTSVVYDCLFFTLSACVKSAFRSPCSLFVIYLNSQMPAKSENISGLRWLLFFSNMLMLLSAFVWPKIPLLLWSGTSPWDGTSRELTFTLSIRHLPLPHPRASSSCLTVSSSATVGFPPAADDSWACGAAGDRMRRLHTDMCRDVWAAFEIDVSWRVPSAALN